MPRIAWATDVHFEFCSRARIAQFAEEVFLARPDLLVLAGDTANARSLTTALELIHQLVPCPIYFVLGNHDFYHGSVGDVRRTITTLTETNATLRWLPTAAVVSLSADTALIGVDGWGDARYGDFEGSAVRLNDFRLIAELRGLDHAALGRQLNLMGDEEARLLRHLLTGAITAHHSIVVVTHVPPFPEAAWHEGQPSGPDFAPFFACKATGDVLLAAAEERADVKFLVLCGHTHGHGEYNPRPNLRILTGGAVYGEPQLQGVFEVI